MKKFLFHLLLLSPCLVSAQDDWTTGTFFYGLFSPQACKGLVQIHLEDRALTGPRRMRWVEDTWVRFDDQGAPVLLETQKAVQNKPFERSVWRWVPDTTGCIRMDLLLGDSTWSAPHLGTRYACTNGKVTKTELADAQNKGTHVTQYSYGPNGNIEARREYTVKQPEGVEKPRYSETYAYDDQGRLVSILRQDVQSTRTLLAYHLDTAITVAHYTEAGTIDSKTEISCLPGGLPRSAVKYHYEHQRWVPYTQLDFQYHTRE